MTIHECFIQSDCKFPFTIYNENNVEVKIVNYSSSKNEFYDQKDMNDGCIGGWHGHNNSNWELIKDINLPKWW